MTDTTINNNWFTEAFDALYPIVYSHRNIAAAAPEVRYAVESLSIDASTQVLDLCCGAGRHLHHLADHTAALYGLDYSEDLLHKAHQHVGHAAQLVRADMRAIPFHNCFDVVLNFFTSFGYFLDMEQNQAVLHGIQAALRPGGRLLMDHINMQSVRKNLEPHSRRTVKQYAIEETRWIDDATQRVNKCTLITSPTGDMQEITESVRLFSLEEISGYLAEAGFTVQACHGDYDGRSFAADTPRMILIADT